MNKKDVTLPTLWQRDFVLSLIGGVLIVAALFLAFAPESLWRRRSLAPEVERKAGTSFVFPDLDGKAWQLKEQRGKVVLVNYWAAWCPPCRKETLDLMRLANAYKTKGFEVVGISLDEDISVIRPFVDEFKIPYPILVPDKLASLPQNIRGLPTSVLYDQEGRIAKLYIGAVTESVLKADDAYLDLTGADVAFSHGWRYGAPVLPGKVTVEDLWQMIPTNPEVFTVEMTGAQIRQKIEASLESVYAPDAFNQRGGYVIRVSGLNTIVRLNNPKNTRVEQLDIAGAPFNADRRYTVAAAGEQDVQEGENSQRTGVQAIDALRHYFKRHSPIEAELTHTKFVAV